MRINWESLEKLLGITWDYTGWTSLYLYCTDYTFEMMLCEGMGAFVYDIYLLFVNTIIFLHVYLSECNRKWFVVRKTDISERERRMPVLFRVAHNPRMSGRSQSHDVSGDGRRSHVRLATSRAWHWLHCARRKRKVPHQYLRTCRSTQRSGLPWRGDRLHADRRWKKLTTLSAIIVCFVDNIIF